MVSFWLFILTLSTALIVCWQIIAENYQNSNSLSDTDPLVWILKEKTYTQIKKDFYQQTAFNLGHTD